MIVLTVIGSSKSSIPALLTNRSAYSPMHHIATRTRVSCPNMIMTLLLPSYKIFKFTKCLTKEICHLPVPKMYVMLCTKPWQCTHGDQGHLLLQQSVRAIHPLSHKFQPVMNIIKSRSLRLGSTYIHIKSLLLVKKPACPLVPIRR